MSWAICKLHLIKQNGRQANSKFDLFLSTWDTLYVLYCQERYSYNFAKTLKNV